MEREAEEDLAAVRVLADEDVTQLGEELTRLDGEVARLDRDGRVDYQKALDAYEAAQRSVPRMRRADDVAAVVDTLSTARYAMACVRARLDGQPLGGGQGDGPLRARLPRLGPRRRGRAPRAMTLASGPGH